MHLPINNTASVRGDGGQYVKEVESHCTVARLDLLIYIP